MDRQIKFIKKKNWPTTLEKIYIFFVKINKIKFISYVCNFIKYIIVLGIYKII